MSLSPEQAAIVARPIGDTVKVLAGAGTGKTRVLVARYLKFVFEDEVPPDRLLALTFTVKAAAEMHGRVFEEVRDRGDEATMRALYGAWIMNFHQFAYRVINENTAAFGLRPEVSVASEVDLARVKSEVWGRFVDGRLQLPQDFEDDIPKPNDLKDQFDNLIMKVVDQARGRLWTPESLRETVTEMDVPAYSRWVETVIAVWRAYEEGLQRRQLLDFADLIHIVVHRFRTDPALVTSYAGRFDHILVDEFQDTSIAQNELVKLLSGGTYGKVTVVGDDKQSIYRWRDAQVENLRDLEAPPHYLKGNYRSTQTILDLAHRLITKDEYFEKCADEIELKAKKRKGTTTVSIFHPPDETDGMDFKADARALGAWILSLTGEANDSPFGAQAGDGTALAYDDIAILMRSVKPSSGLPHYEAELKRLRIPYAIVGGVNAMESQVLETFKNTLRLAIYRDDARALLALAEAAPLDVPDKYMRQIFRANPGRFSFNKVLSAQTVELVESGDIRERLVALRDIVELLADRRAQLDLGLFVAEALERTHFLYQLFDQGADVRIIESITKRIFEIVEQLTLRNESNLAAFVESIETLLEERQLNKIDGPDVPPGHVAIMTEHQAKGLEFPAVAVPGIKGVLRRGARFYLVPDEGLYASKQPGGRDTKECPHLDRYKNENDQEERCLLYVAITRAEEHLFMSSPFAGGVEKYGKKNLFSDVLEVLREGGIPFEEHRHVEPATPRPTAADDLVADVGELAELTDEWFEDRGRIEEARLLAKPSPQGIEFVNWRALLTFSRCPLQYYYRYVIGIQDDLLVHGDQSAPGEDREPVVLAPDFELPAGVLPAYFGTVVHDVMNAWLSDENRDLDAAVGRTIARHGMAGYEKTFTDLLSKCTGVANAMVHQLEVPARRRVGNTVMHGIVDRIDEADDGFHVIDYKVGAASDEYDFQVKFYAWLLEPSLACGRGSIAYLLDGSRLHDIDVSGEAIGEVGSAASELEEAIAAAEYPAQPGRVCGFCEFQTLCPHASGVD